MDQLQIEEKQQEIFLVYGFVYDNVPPKQVRRQYPDIHHTMILNKNFRHFTIE